MLSFWFRDNEQFQGWIQTAGILVQDLLQWQLDEFAVGNDGDGAIGKQ